MYLGWCRAKGPGKGLSVVTELMWECVDNIAHALGQLTVVCAKGGGGRSTIIVNLWSRSHEHISEVHYCIFVLGFVVTLDILGGKRHVS